MPESPAVTTGTEATGQPEGGHLAAAGEQKVAGKVFSVVCKGHKYVFSSDLTPKDDAMHVVRATDVLANTLELTFKNKMCVSVGIVK